MRYIKYTQTEINFPPNWLTNAQAAYQEVSNIPAEDRLARKRAINAKSHIWGELKESLSTLSYNKCWYCESRENRSNKAVDHHRPKNEVFEAPDHPGYWWLAFEWQNYRYSCQLCNEIRIDYDTGIRYGKGTHFPLFDETRRLTDPGQRLSQEDPVLLDPINPVDCRLLSFDTSGFVGETYRQETNPRFYQRANVSITYYNLNDPEVQERRQRDVCNRVMELVNRGDEYWVDYQNGDRNARTAFSDVFKDLEDMISKEAEYSSAALSVLKIYRDREWVRELFGAS